MTTIIWNRRFYSDVQLKAIKSWGGEGWGEAGGEKLGKGIGRFAFPRTFFQPLKS